MGCGGNPEPLSVNAADEKEDEAALRKAGAAEGKGKAWGKKGGKWEPHPDDE
jgi:hypothetical protein